MAIQITDRPTTAAPAVRGRWVYGFAEGSRDMRDLLGGKGANVAEMTRVLGPERVPAGFTITTEACGDISASRAWRSARRAAARRGSPGSCPLWTSRA